jgi:hypothetical protein
VSKRTVIELAIEYIRQMQDQLLSLEENGQKKPQEESAGSSVVNASCAFQLDDAASKEHNQHSNQKVTGAESTCNSISTASLHHGPYSGYCLEQYNALASDMCQVCGCFTDATLCFGKDQAKFATSLPK